jgi:hypothetical protein
LFPLIRKSVIKRTILGISPWNRKLKSINTTSIWELNPFDSPGFAVLIGEANEGGLKPGVYPAKTAGLAHQSPEHVQG